MLRTTALLVTGLALGACGGNTVATTSPEGQDPPPTTTEPEALALDLCSTLEDSLAAPLDGPPSTDPEVAAGQRGRAEVGLPSDEGSTRAAAAAVNNDPMADAFGFPTTDAELTEFGARSSHAGAADRVRSLLGEDVDASLALDNRHGTVEVRTAGDSVALQATLDDALGAGEAEVISVPFGLAQLSDLAERVIASLNEQEISWSGVSGGGNRIARVGIGLEVLDPAAVAAIAEAFPNEREAICVDGASPADVVPELPQPQGGEGWRLLADAPEIGAPYASGFAADEPAALRELWERIGLSGPPPMVDFATEVVAWFGPAVSGSCSNIRLDAVVFDGAAAAVYPEIVLAGGARACTDDANPHAYVVALDRSYLPGDRFVVTIQPPNTECCPEGTTPVDLFELTGLVRPGQRD